MSTNKPEIVYQYILSYKAKYDGNSPSYYEIAGACNISSTSLVAHYLEQLMKQGRIEMSEGTARPRIMIKGGMWSRAGGEAS